MGSGVFLVCPLSVPLPRRRSPRACQLRCETHGPLTMEHPQYRPARHLARKMWVYIYRIGFLRYFSDALAGPILHHRHRDLTLKPGGSWAKELLKRCLFNSSVVVDSDCEVTGICQPARPTLISNFVMRTSFSVVILSWVLTLSPIKPWTTGILKRVLFASQGHRAARLKW